MVTGLSSFLAALAIGLLFSCVNFVIRYGRIPAVRHSLTGNQKRSRVERSATERSALETHGRLIRMLTLQGYLFFGTANAVLEAARAYLDEHNEHRPRYLILDFAAVAGMDSSAANSFAKLALLAQRAGAELLLCSVSAADREVLARLRGGRSHDGHSSVFADLDHALEWSEDQLLAQVLTADAESVENWLERELGSAERARAFFAYFDEVRIAAQTALFRRGDLSDALFVVVSGRLRVSIEEFGGYRRLRSMVAGSVIGEMGMFTDEPRSADVTAERDATLLRLTRSAFAQMNEQDPSLAGTFVSLLFRLEAERLRFASAEIAALEA